MVFDALLDAAALRARDVEAMRFFGVAGALVPSSDAFHPATAAALRDHWLATVASVRTLRRAGLPAWAALGVDPRRIPRRGVAERLAELPELLGRREVAALGPAGLEAGGAEEEEVFLAQARLAAQLRLPLLVRTGWRTRARQLGRLLALLEETDLPPERVLVLHADARTLPVLRARGHRALVTMPGRHGVDEAARLVARHGAEGIVLGSDAGGGGGDLLALPRVADRLQRAGLSLAVIRRACLTNALGWLGLEPGALG
jgi:predicted metal-dependent TIM-barrel fold hydrolase